MKKLYLRRYVFLSIIHTCIVRSTSFDNQVTTSMLQVGKLVLNRMLQPCEHMLLLAC